MTTPTNNAELFAQTAIATLLKFKPSMKVDDNLMASIVEDLQAIMLVSSEATKLTTVTRAMLPSLNSGAMFDTLTDDIVIHVPSFYRSTKAINGQGNEALLVTKQSVTFTLDSYSVESVRFFSLALTGLCIQPDWSQSISVEHNDNCKLTELVDRVIPMLQGATQLTTLTTNSVKNYQALATKMGLEYFTNYIHTGYGAEGYDQHREDNTAISIYVKVDKADTVETVMTPKKGGTFIYQAENLQKYDVVPSNIVEGRQVVAVKYRFTSTKA